MFATVSTRYLSVRSASRYSVQRREMTFGAIPVKEELTQLTPGSSVPQETPAVLLSGPQLISHVSQALRARNA